MKMGLQIAKYPVTLCISVGLFFLAMEVSARIDDHIRYGAPFFGHYSSKCLRATDPDGIRHNVPSSRFEKWHVNRYGFRGPEVELEKSHGLVRVVCMGTSETFGLYESPAMEWPAQLREMLDEQDFQVINAAVVGLDLNKYQSYLEKYVLRFKPDILILLVNPFGYAVGIERFSKKQVSAKMGEEKGKVIHLLGKMKPELRVFEKMKEALKRALPPVILREFQVRRMSGQVRSIEEKRLNGNEPTDVVPQENIDTFETDFRNLINFLESRGIKVIVASYPVLINNENLNQHPEVFTDFRRFFVELSLRGIIVASEVFNRSIKAVAEELGVAFIDLNGILPKNTKYFGDNVHYTNEGARIVADDFAELLISRYSVLSQEVGR